MFDRYVEALNARYSDRFEDVARDVSDVESRAANATAEARAAAAAAAAAAEECDATVRDAARRHSGDAAAADERVRALRAELDATRRAWRISFGVGLLVVAGLAALLAAASAAHAVAVSGKDAREGTVERALLVRFREETRTTTIERVLLVRTTTRKVFASTPPRRVVAAAALAASAGVAPPPSDVGFSSDRPSSPSRDTRGAPRDGRRAPSRAPSREPRERA